jgi:AcrR family transcriptional regulator
MVSRITRHGSAREAAAVSTDPLLADIEPAAARRLISAGLTCFADRGYEATTTRDISMDSGMSPAALYVYFPSKEELLFRIIEIAHHSVLDVVQAAVDSETELMARVRSFVREFTVWHAEHHTLARVAQYELAALAPEHLAAIAKVRRRTEAVLRNEIEQCSTSPEFEVGNVRDVTRAILSLGIDLCRWFRDDADLTPPVIGETYATLALRMLGAEPVLIGRT